MRVSRTILAAGAAAIALGVSGIPAHADPTDGGSALVSTLNDMADGLGGVDLSANPNIACKVEAYGTAITQHTPLVVGEVYGSDQGYGRLTCISFDTLVYNATVTVRLQYLSNPALGVWSSMTGCPAVTGRGSTTNGVLVIPLTQTQICQYLTGSPYLNKYHRAFASATTNFGALGPQPTAPSPSTWYMNP
ncbi:MAG TPA: hypothetical protein VNA20_15225 [Frankiaceae bacterium]|nr:hypothetical protein [Frankiaceae bacterium]